MNADYSNNFSKHKSTSNIRKLVTRQCGHEQSCLLWLVGSKDYILKNDCFILFLDYKNSAKLKKRVHRECGPCFCMSLYYSSPAHSETGKRSRDFYWFLLLGLYFLTPLQPGALHII